MSRAAQMAPYGIAEPNTLDVKKAIAGECKGELGDFRISKETVRQS
jgi:hypothetical protein